jgi:hypothetical protein
LNKCSMIKTATGSGGNRVSGNAITIRRSAAIGDVIASTVIADRLFEMGYQVNFQTHPNIHCVLRRMRSVTSMTTPGAFSDINLDAAYESDQRRRIRHFHEMFFERAQEQLQHRNISLGPPFNCRPSMRIEQHEKEYAAALFAQYPRPWVFVCPRSDSYNVRQVPDGIWSEAAGKISGTKFWLGRHPGPPGLVDLKCQHLDNLIVWLSVADLFIGVDTGPLHIAAAMGIPIVAIGQSSTPELHLSDQRDFVTIEPKLDCLNCQQNICHVSHWEPPCQKVDPALIANWANARLNSVFGDSVSAIISVYRPETQMLNHSIEAILPQVSEVIVVRDQAGLFPPGCIQHPKIRYYTHRLHDIGLSRKWNYAARQSNGRYLLFVNDDFYANPGMVTSLSTAIKSRPGVGIVAPLIHYPNGQIYHAGKIREPNSKGWGHIDHRKYEHTLKDVTELENVCGCCMLVDRRAWFDSGCADDEVYLYTEDDRICLSVRRAGYRVLFTPHGSGIHDEGMSTKKTDRIIQIMEHSNATFGRKWNRYFEHNANRIPGNFDYERV